MKKRRYLNVALLTIGLALAVASFVIPLVALAAAPPDAGGIIGGADAPTYWFLYVQMRGYVLTAVGAALMASSLFVR